MNQLILHRGPDAVGFDVENGVALGHTRLSILDLSESGTQPMFSPFESRIVFNGEIYNYIEIRDELKVHGYSFKTGTDTEVILAAYDFWGETCTSRFNGMWAFILVDTKNQKVFCSRDRFGIKPFYYIRNGGEFRISSEIKPLLPYLKERRANKQALANFLVLDICDEAEHTFFEDVFRLLPGHNLVINLANSEWEIYRHYDLKPSNIADQLDPSETLADLMSKSIELRLRSDVRVGSCLSGGLDSSFISGSASIQNAKKSQNKFMAFTSQSTDPDNDETRYAEQVVDFANLEWVRSTPSLENFLDLIDEVVLCQEEPFRSPSIFMQYGIMKAAAENNCKVLLDGQGGDETFLGYERYFISYLNSLSIPKRFRAMRDIVQNSKWNWSRLIQMYAYLSFPVIRTWKLKRKGRIFKKDFLQFVDWEYVKELNASSIESLQKAEIQKFNLPALLRYEDKNSMHFAIETRLPFLDYRIVEFAIGLKAEEKIHKGWTKYLVRKASRNIIPESIAWRKNKIGFEPPMEQWFKENDVFLKEIGESPIIRAICRGIPENISDKNLLWKLVNISRWSKLFNVSLD